MKYKDLIEKLLPFAEEEVSITVCETKKFYSATDDSEMGDRQFCEAEVRFFHSLEDNNDMIVGVKEQYDAESFETIGEAKIILG